MQTKSIRTHRSSGIVGWRADAAPFLSVVIPALNEEGNIKPLAQRLLRTLEDLTDRFEIVFVSDGSRDRTCERVRGLSARDARV